MAHTIDFSFSEHGSLYLVSASNPEALSHLQDNVSDEAQWVGESLVVEARYAGALAAALVEAGYLIDIHR